MHFGNISDRLIEALINGGYQGLLLIACTALIIKALPRSNAATRHAILFVALLISASLPVLHFVFPARVGASVVSLGTPAKEEIRTTPAVAQKADAGAKLETQTMLPIPSHDLDVAAKDQISERQDPKEFWIIESRAIGFSSVIPQATIGSSVATVPSPTQDNGKTIKPIQDLLQRMIALLKASLPTSKTVSLLVLMILFAAALGRTIKLSFQYLQLRRLKEVAASASERSVTLFEELKGELGITRNARLLVHGAIGSPIAMGFRKPAVVLPQEMEATASEQQLEQLLRHELAHLKRFDDWTNLVQQLIKEIYCFHPGILWLSRRLTIEREIACDDQVLAADESRKAYALFLTEFASRRTSREWAAAQAAWSNRSQLKERIDMILNSKRNAAPGVARTRTVATGAFAALLAALALTSAPRLAFAQSPTPAAESEGSKTENSFSSPQNKTVEEKEDVLIQVEPGELKEEEIILESPSEEGTNKLILRTPKKVQRIERRIVVSPEGAPGFQSLPVPALAPVQQSTPPRAPSAAPAGKTDVDGRLERLEKMMEQLLAREGGKKDEDMITSFKNPDSDLRERDPADIQNLREKLNRMMKNAQPFLERQYEKPNPGFTQKPFDQQTLTEGMERAMKDAQPFLDAEKIRRSEKEKGISMERRQMSAAAEKEALRAHQQSLEQQLNAIQARLDSLEQKEKAEKQQLKAREESLKAAKKETAKKNEADADKIKSRDQEAGATVSVDGRLAEAKRKLQDMLLQYSKKHPAVIAQRDLISTLEKQQNYAPQQQDQEKANDPSAEKF